MSLLTDAEKQLAREAHEANVKWLDLHDKDSALLAVKRVEARLQEIEEVMVIFRRQQMVQNKQIAALERKTLDQAEQIKELQKMRPVLVELYKAHNGTPQEQRTT